MIKFYLFLMRASGLEANQRGLKAPTSHPTPSASHSILPFGKTWVQQYPCTSPTQHFLGRLQPPPTDHQSGLGPVCTKMQGPPVKLDYSGAWTTMPTRGLRCPPICVFISFVID